ncbi:MAG TPA: hypothetical protein VHM02_00060 [Thermoanaerobaculia bacterium]|nr:hypothetical protein [Thermoanaerobaculia bacterium]
MSRHLSTWRRACAFAAVAALGAALPAAAMDLNGFLPEAGTGDVALSFTDEGYDEFWAGETRVSDPGVGEVEIQSLSLWGRWGFTDRFAIVANLPYVDADSDGLGGFEDSGIQDLSALGLFRFWEGGPHSLTGGAGVRTDVGDYEANLPVDLGDGTTDALFRLVYQLTSGKFYVSQQVGYDARGGDAPDGFPFYTEAGWTVGRVTLSGFYQHYEADGGTDIGDPGFTFPSNREEFQRAGAKVYARASSRWGFSVAGFTTLDGRNTGDTSGFSVGVVAGL